MENRESWKRIPGGNIDSEALIKPRYVKIRYRGRAIQSITVLHEGEEEAVESKVEIQYSNGKQISWYTTKVNVVYGMLWGIPLSFDCRYIYAPQSNGGVCCLSVEDGSVKWKSKSKATFMQILVNPNGSICCASGPHDVVILDGDTGIEKNKRYITKCNQFQVLGKDRILVEATSQKYYVFNSETLETIEVITKKELNTQNGREIWKRIYAEWNSAFREDDV